MVAPGSTGANFDVLLAFSLDEEANRRVAERVSTIQEELKRIEDQAKKTGRAMNEGMSKTEKTTQAVEKSISRMGVALSNLEKQGKTTTDQIDKGLAKDAKRFEELAKQANKAKIQFNQIGEFTSKLSGVFTQVAAKGFLLLGGIFLGANQYAKEAGNATEETRKWAEATDELTKARNRVNAVLLQEALPLLEKAADLATRAAKIVEDHPEIVGLALKAGVILAGIGTIGFALSNGIKLVADTASAINSAKELLAATLQEKAANKMLAAATLQSKGGINPAAFRGAFGVGGGAAATGGAAAIAQTVLVGLGSILAGGFIGDKIGEAIAKKINPNDTANYGAADYLTEFKQALSINAYQIGSLFGKEQEFFVKVRDALGLVEKQSDETADSLENLANAEKAGEIKKAFTTWQQEDKKIIEDATRERARIVKDSEQSIVNATRSYQQKLNDINNQYAQQRGELTRNYAAETAKAEADYQNERADIIKDANTNVQKIEQDYQKERVQMEKDHRDRVADLVSSRDALGLAKEKRQYAEQQAEAESRVNDAIKQEQAETAARLEELAKRYQEERLERERNYRESLRELQRNYALQRREAQAAYMAQIQDLRNAKLQELRDLESFLQQEREAKRRAYLQTLADLGATAPASLTSSPTTTPTTGGGFPVFTVPGGMGYAAGGYASYGQYILGDRPGGGAGAPEFVMSGATTRAAENVIGGNLSQASLMEALSLYGAARRSMNYTDNRRFNSGISVQERRAIQRDTIEVVNGMLTGVLNGR